jgi:DNA-binding response OmpR family regulator
MEYYVIMSQLVIVEDDERLAKLIGSFFERSGFIVHLFDHGQTAIKYCQENTADIIILDLNLPDIDGISVCSQLRRFYQGRILILTASGNDLDQIDGFEMGADDFVKKPVEPRVLLARIKALLKRDKYAENNQQENRESNCNKFGVLKIDQTSRTVTLKNDPINLTSHEFDLLNLFAKNAGIILSRDVLYQTLRGFGYDGMDRAIDIKISRLRKKLNDDATKPTRIKTIWGKGYLFVPTAWDE